MARGLGTNLGDFGEAYDSNHMATVLVDLASQNEGDKPIIAVHKSGRNDIFSLPISEEEQDRFIQKVNGTKKELSELSQNAIAKEFDAMFALLEAKKRRVLYTRVMPKDDELFDGVKGRNFSHWVLISFFYDHNNKKSILISNPNANEIIDSNEITPISSYLKKNPDVEIYHTRDYLQLDNNFCGPGSLIALRALYNMNEDSFKEILRSGKQKNMGDSGFRYISIELGCDALQKVIGKIPRLAITKTPKTHAGEEVQDKVDPLRGEIAQVLRKVDYDTSQVFCSSNNGVPFAQEFIEDIEGNFTPDQKKLLKEYLISGKNLLSQEKIQQIKKNREKNIEELNKNLNKKYSRLYEKEKSTSIKELVEMLEKKDEELLSIISAMPTAGRTQVERPNVSEKTTPFVNIPKHDSDIQQQSILAQENRVKRLKNHLGEEQENDNHTQQQTPILQAGSKPNNIRMYSFLVIGAIVGAAVAYLAGAATLTPLSAAVTTFIVSVAVGALIGYGIWRFCEKVSENNPGSGISDAVKSVFSNVFITNGHSESKSFT